MLASLLLTPILFAAAYYVPGRLAYALLPGPRPRGEAFAASVGLGVVLVGATTITVHGGYFRQYLDLGLAPWFVLAVSLALSVVLAAIGWWRGTLREGLRWRRPDRDQIGLAALTVFSTLFFLLNFDVDQIVHSSCIIEATSSLARPTFTDAPELWVFEGDFDGQRLGIGVIMTPLVALFGNVGYRIAYVLHGLLAPGLGYALGHHVLGRRGGAWAVAILFTFSAYAFEIRIYDENLMSSVFGTLALVLLLRPRPAPLAAGVAMSLFLGIRHVGMLILPAALVLAWYGARRRPGGARPWRSVLVFLVGALVFMTPYILIHIQRWVLDGRLFEGVPVLPTKHSFLGFEFEAARPLNWPFLPEPVRSPFQPYPNLVLYPLDFVRRFGLLLLSLAPLGWLATWRRGRTTSLALLAWFAVPVGFILFLSNWYEPNKMGIPASTIAPLVLFIVAGAVALWDARRRPWKRLALVVGTAAALVALVLGVRGWETPLDLRLRTAYRITEHERPDLHVFDEPAYLDWQRSRYGLSLLPEVRADFWHPTLFGLQLRQLGDAFAAADIADHRRPLPDHFWSLCEWSDTALNIADYQSWCGGVHGPRLHEGGDPDEPHELYTLDLNQAPAVGPAPLVPGGTGAEPLALRDGEIVVVDDLEAPWSEFPMRLFLGRDHLGTIHLMVLPVAEGDVECRRPPGTRSLDMSAWPDRRIPLRLPVDAVLRIEDVRNPFFEIAYVRFAATAPGAVWLSGTEPMTLAHRRGNEGDP